MNILIVGYSGSGKTSLIQALTSKDIVKDSKIAHGYRGTEDFESFTIDGVTFWDSRGLEMGETEDAYRQKIGAFIRDKSQSDDCNQHIHIVWYCISGDRARVTPLDLNLIKSLSEFTIIVVTKNDLIKREQRKDITEALISNGINEKLLVYTSSVNSAGLKTLLNKSFNILPDAHAQSLKRLLNRKKEEIETRIENEVEDLIIYGAARAFAIAMIPIPLADLPLLVANEAYMICAIGAQYGIAVTNSMIATFLGTLGASIAGKGAASMIPFFKAPIAAGITYGVGKAAQAYFKNDMKTTEKELKRIFKLNKKYKHKNAA
ncbi:MAG: DUF697 domain-containing protein [Oligoflexia bacterium]|nr:DUF697 domain-containing protein [Oligoflexia bacterium]